MIPASLEESAVIDGANTPTVFLKIILPLSIPILATISIFGAVGNWNSFQDSLLLMSSRPELYTLQHRLYVYLNQSSNLSALVNGSGGMSTQAAANMLNTRMISGGSLTGLAGMATADSLYMLVNYPDSAGVPVYAALLC